MFGCLCQVCSWFEPPVRSPLTNPSLFKMASIKKSPLGGSSGRKSQTQIRSPTIKRSPSSPVTLQGWLHKQGSDGLMLWKKRWFVLSDYCLFYYKGPEEEKLLGSFLLASYKISPCTAEDKIYRKFSFKAEHANMRTYYFAADNQTLMTQWMNALSLASILQECSSPSDDKNKSSDPSDGGFNGNFHPPDDMSTNRWQVTQYQPLYANAPPKPRRLNETSPECSPERYSHEGRTSRMAQPQEYPSKIYYQPRPSMALHTASIPVNNVERRTPDTYGRSKTAAPQTTKIIPNRISHYGDYEDVYKQSVPCQYVPYKAPPPIHHPPPVTSSSFPPRPHSADFLEYDTKRKYEGQSIVERSSPYYNFSGQPRRPKSSLDVVANDENHMDSIHWSEESYARKMRQSSVYVSPQFHNLSNSSRATTPSMKLSTSYQNKPLYGATGSDHGSAVMRNHSELIHRQERRWSEYLDSRSTNQFMRSASARLPRSQRGEFEDDDSDKSSLNMYRRRNSSDSKDGASGNKVQQREESMKRLLEWKQRMLQSPLTRKSPNSASSRTAPQSLPKYYKRASLKETSCRKSPVDDQSKSSSETAPLLKNSLPIPKTPYDWDSYNGEPKLIEGSRTLPKYEGKVTRRKHDETSRLRSRSQDRASSASGYTNYSSGDEDLAESREQEMRKRYRRSSQSGRNRPAAEEPPCPDYENVEKKTSSAAMFHLKSTVKEQYDSNSALSIGKFKTSSSSINYRVSPTGSKSPSKLSMSGKETAPGNNNYDIQKRHTVHYDDRLGYSSKHSDSGYDTLQHSYMLSDLQNNSIPKHQTELKPNPSGFSDSKFKPDEEWGLKLDESRVIKEFSYHYIKSGINESNESADEDVITNPNIFLSRNKPFHPCKEGEGDNLELSNALGQQNPMSPCQIHLPNSHDSGIPTLSPPLQYTEGNIKAILKTASISHLENILPHSNRSSPSKIKKSVKDILSDFEHKSRKPMERINNDDSNSNELFKRSVLSDSEMLQFQMSNENELFTKTKFSGSKKTDPIHSEEEDRDEEVAAVLGKHESFVSACREIGSSECEAEHSKAGNRDTNYAKPKTTGTIIKHTKVKGSTCETPLILLHQKDDSISSELKCDNHEEHYMPMTPRKKSVLSPTSDIISHTRSSSAHALMTECVFNNEEESPYVEMTQNGLSNSVLAPSNLNSSLSKSDSLVPPSPQVPGPDSPRYCEIDNKETHYEFIYKASTSEPLYMEVNTLANYKDKNKHVNHESENVRSKSNEVLSREKLDDSEPNNKFNNRGSLPDILNSSASIPANGSPKSDSSDADDEASKDLDSLDAPRHPRFSLSDTFRPASYYLGGCFGERTLMGMTSEHPDSSDSDLVSPPPIPTSPPPMDDLETSLDSTVSVKKLSPLPGKSDLLNDSIWNSHLVKTSSLTLMSRLERSKKLSDCIDDGSSESDSITCTSKRERLMKRRPVSADLLDSLNEANFVLSSPSSDRRSGGSDIESIGSRNGITSYLEDSESIDYDQYLEELQRNNQDCSVDSNYETLVVYAQDKYDMPLPKEPNEFSDNGLGIGTLNTSNPSQCKVMTTSNYEEAYYENLQGIYHSQEGNTIDSLKHVSADTKQTTSSPTLATGQTVSRPQSEDQQASAPYYYSDILKVDASNLQKDSRRPSSKASRSIRGPTLNNQRDSQIEAMMKRNDIGRKVNQISHYNFSTDSEADEATRLAEELRSASADLLASSEKSNCDSKNIYISDTLKRQRVAMGGNLRSQTPDFRESMKNIYPFGIRDKSHSSASTSSYLTPEFQVRRRSRSLEGLLDEVDEFRSEPRVSKVSPGNAISRLLQTTQMPSQPRPESSTALQAFPSSSRTADTGSGRDVWEEDTLWRENLRKVSIRHTRSLDDLDPNKKDQPSPSKSEMEATYVNGEVANKTHPSDTACTTQSSHPTVSSVDPDDLDDGVHYERLVRDPEGMKKMIPCPQHPGNTERHTKRPGKPVEKHPPHRKPGTTSYFLEAGSYRTRPPSFEIDREKLRQWDLMSSAPSGMLNGGKPLPKAIQDQDAAHPSPSSTGSASGSVVRGEVLPSREVVIDKPPLLATTAVANQIESKKADNWNMKVSAGELLGRTHEELVLLLIQLRRQSAGVCKAMENCHREIEAQARIVEIDPSKKVEQLQKLDDLKRHLQELEKQYEKGKPLVNLVDNMVKLGSLYRAGSGVPPQKLEFNHKVQEQRLLAEERRDWERISPDHNKLQAKVEQLYRLDKLLQKESDTLQSLQQDKEMLERALGGLKHKMQDGHYNPVETERYRRQQRTLERELSRVRSILAQNSKKLEETVAENARLEQELVVLRQKLQWSRRATEPCGATTANLEMELHRVQNLVGDLQRQRQELSMQVKQLTEKSNSLSQQIRPGPTGVAGVGTQPTKRRSSNSWLETDLDSQVTQDAGIETPRSSPQHTFQFSPLYVNTDGTNKVSQPYNTFEGGMSDECCESSSPMQQHSTNKHEFETDDRVKKFYGMVQKEKPQEIKTVRIVKRESERRQRDRDRSGSLGIPLTNPNSRRVTIIEEPLTQEQADNNKPSDEEIKLNDRIITPPPVNPPPSNNIPPPLPGPRSDSVNAIRNIMERHEVKPSDCESGGLPKEKTLEVKVGSPQLSPVYLSETARKIVEEVAWKGAGGRRLIPKEKRRHHTVSGQSIMRHHTLYSPGGSRDDLDMERALRPRFSTPDVVRSTLNRIDSKFTTETIDKILGAPNKIVIPERYIPETETLSQEEQQKRSQKADAIRKMLSETSSIAPSDAGENAEEENSSTIKKKAAEEKRQRDHLLQLNQILAQQVMEKSKIVAGLSPLSQD